MKRCAWFFLLLLLITQVFAASVSMERAQVIASNWLTHVKGARATASDVTTLDYQGHTSLYIVSFSEGGFVIIPADDSVIPVLGYSETNVAVSDITHPAVQEWFEDYHRQIDQFMNEKLTNEGTLPLWQDIESSQFSHYPLSRGVNALVTTTWNQGQYYNEQCPYDITSTASNNNVWAGCVATAMAQVMRYHSHPAVGYGSHSYTSAYGTESANFGSTTYSWLNMPTAVTSGSTTTQKNAVQGLIYDCAVSVDMNFGPTGSGAQMGSALKALVMFFNYDNGLTYHEYSDLTSWKNMLKAEHNAGRPVLYAGSGTGGHAFVCDGYNDSDYFHFNWGWGGAYNGYFAIGSLNPGTHNYSSSNNIIIGIKPSTSTNTYPLFTSWDGFDVAGWNLDYNGDSTDDWLYYYSNPHTGVHYLGAKHPNVWLISPQITLPSNTQDTFTLWTNRLNSFNQGFNVYISTTGNNYTTDFNTQLGTIGVGTSWSQSSFDLSNYAGQSIYLGFKTTGTDDATYYYIFLEDLQIESSPITNPTVSATDPATAILHHRATLGGTVTDNGGASLIQRGICYAPYNNVPSSGLFVPATGTDVGSFSIILTGLAPGLRYNACAYAVNSSGLFGFGPVVDFITDVYPPTGTSTQTAADGIVPFPTTGLDINFTGVAGAITNDVTIDVIEEAPQEPGIAFLSAPNPADFSFVITNNTGFTFLNGQLQFNVDQLNQISSGGIDTSLFLTMDNDTDTGIQLWHRSDYLSGDFTLLGNLFYHDNNDINGDLDDYLYANTTSFSEFTMSGGANHTLPVELSSFSAIVTSEEAVKLEWITQSESEMAGYNVLRSVTDVLDESLQVNLQMIPSQNEPDGADYNYLDTDVTSDATFHYWLQGVNLDGSSKLYGPVSVTVQYSESDEETPEVVLVNKLEAAYPNPFNPSTTILFTVKENDTAKVRIFNLKGELIRDFTGYQSGVHKIVWDGEDRNGRKVGSGIYLYRLDAGSQSTTRKMMLIK